MRQSISTKYLGATNFRGSRVKATTSSGHTLTKEWDDGHNADWNHRNVAQRLADKLGWAGEWYGGGTERGCVFVNRDDMPDSFFFITKSERAA